MNDRLEEDFEAKRESFNRKYDSCREILMDKGSAQGGFLTCGAFVLILGVYLFKTTSLPGIVFGLALAVACYVFGWIGAHRSLHWKLDRIYDDALFPDRNDPRRST
jgi:hypothetical protein